MFPENYLMEVFDQALTVCLTFMPLWVLKASFHAEGFHSLFNLNVSRHF